MTTLKYVTKKCTQMGLEGGGERILIIQTITLSEKLQNLFKTYKKIFFFKFSNQIPI